MIELVLQLALSNLVISVVLAGLAYAVDRTNRYPAIAHVLWVLVLVKVLTPPVFTLALVPVAPPTPAAGALGHVTDGALTQPALAALMDQVSASAPLFLLGWAVGSGVVLVVSLLRIRRFDGLLRRTSSEAPANVQALGASLATRLRIRAHPAILITKARLSPLTWWTGGRVRIVLPAALCEVIGTEQLRWVLAHELAHVKRRDHMVRWLEWLACVAFWWNPVVWWARRSLRHDEEVSCDALVLERLDGRPQAYARALLAVVEFLARPAAQPPAVATGIDAGGRLELRFARIVSAAPGRRPSRALMAVGSIAVLTLMTLGVGSAATPALLQGPPAAAPGVASSIVGDTIAIGTGQLDGLGELPGDSVASADAYALLSGEIADASVDEATSPRSRTAPAAGETIGGDGRDVTVGAVGMDTMTGRGGPDRLAGGGGADILRGGGGNDVLSGGAGRDTIRGGAGQDLIVGGSGRDTIEGGRGDDLVRAWRDGEADAVDCGPGDGDRAVLDPADTFVDCEVVMVH